MLLEKLTTLQAKEALKKDPIVVLPIGSIEQHGIHLALGTDYIIPQYFVSKIADREDVVIMPPLPYGCCPYHTAFAGSVDIGIDGVYTVVSGIVRSMMAHGAKKFLFINGHGGNNPALDRVGIETYKAGGVCCSLDWWSLVAELDKSLAGGHGDIQETSVMMAISPEYVDSSAFCESNVTAPSKNTSVAYIQAVRLNGGTVKMIRGTEAVAPNGWCGPGHPKDASVEFGQKCLDMTVDFISNFIDEFKTMEF